LIIKWTFDLWCLIPIITKKINIIIKK
jgi:hypothetical protein